MKVFHNLAERHTDMVRALAKPGAKLVAELTPNSAHLLHMAVGVSGEAGELLDAVKKHAVYVRAIDRANVVEELGDLEFYMEGIRDALQITREEVLDANYNKLKERYKSAAYSNEQAQERADKAPLDRIVTFSPAEGGGVRIEERERPAGAENTPPNTSGVGDDGRKPLPDYPFCPKCHWRHAVAGEALCAECAADPSQ